MHKILLLIIFVCFVGVLYIYSGNFIYPNTTLGDTPINGLTPSRISFLLRAKKSKPLKIQIQDRVYEYTYDKLGISINTEETVNDIFARNRKIFPLNTVYLVQSFFTKKAYLPSITFSPDFYQFTTDTVYDLSTGRNNISVNEAEKRIIYKENELHFKLDRENLRAQIVVNFGKNTVIKPKVHKLSNTLQEKVATQNTKLEKVYEMPLKIVIDDNATAQYITVSPTDLKKLISFDYQSIPDYLQLKLNEPVVNAFINTNQQVFTKDSDKKISVSQFKSDVLSAMHSRLDGIETEAVVAKVDLTPNTNGNLAYKYVEVDISQQRMYLFQNGSQVGAYNISSGLYYPTPTGSFKIMNKATNAFSDIYHVWMPYWMAFYYDPKIKAYMGIHELPYWVAGDGTEVRRPREFIGSPHTAGCVALDLGMAKIVYDFADIGMPVHVFN